MNDSTIDTNQHLTFLLGKEIFAISISSVREVLELTKITKIPRTPEYMSGVINLRGHAVPVIDMRQKLDLPVTDFSVNTCIIIVEATLDGNPVVIGGVVDAVREVFEITDETLEPAPRLGASIKMDYIKGMARQDDDFVIILDIERIFSEEELVAVNQAVTEKIEDPAEAA